MNVLDLLLNAKDSKEEEDEQYIKNACLWLKEAGFPQYVQMYNDNEFPISLKLVQEDHMDFDGGSLMALFRRIEILNKSTETKTESYTERSSTIITNSITISKKPQYEIIEDEENENDEEELDEDDDKENVIEQIALSTQWSYELSTRRWSHIDLVKPLSETKLEETPPKLETYLGVPFPRPFILKSEDKVTVPKTINYKRPTILPFESHRSFEPIIELNLESSDQIADNEHDAMDKMMSSLKVKGKQPITSSNHLNTITPPTSPNSLLKDSLKVDREKDKHSNHILRSASLKLMKAVSRINPNQMSLRHKKDHKTDTTTPKESPSTADGEVPGIKLLTQTEEIDLSKLNLPDKSHEFPHESYSIGDSGWINLRTGSFIARNGNHNDQEFKTSKKNNIIYDLDPVIRLLESDVDSLDFMRSRIKSRTSPDSAPTSPVLRNKFNKQEIKKGQQRLSDFESYTRSNKGPNIEFNDENGAHSRLSSSVAMDQSLDEDAKNWPISSKLNRNNICRWSHTSYFKEKISQYHHILELSVNKVNILKKLSVLSCTSMLEKHCPSQKNVFNWRIPRLLPQKLKLSIENSNFVFGVNLSVCQNRYGQPLPPAILNIFQYLRENGPTTQGIFRKTGMKCRIKELRKAIEVDENLNNFDGYNVNDVADILKTFFRDLPDRLLTNKLSSTLLAIYNYVPVENQLEGLKWALFSLPDENRMALEYLIEFLLYLSTFSDVTKMDVKNLSLCFAPSLFNFQNDGTSNNSMSPLRMKKSNGPNSKLLAEQNAAHLCVVGMINNASALFQITNETLKKASHNSKDKSEQKDVAQFISTNSSNEWIRDKISLLKNDATNHKMGWTNINKDFIKKLHGSNAIVEQLSYRKIGSHQSNSDGVALRTWKVVIDIDVSPGYVFTNIKDKRHLWDPDMNSIEVVKEITEYVDLVRFVSNNPDGSFVPRHFNLLRGYQLSVNGSTHMIFSESIDFDSLSFDGGNNNTNHKSVDVLVGQIFCDNFIMEAISTKLTRVTWISRVDLCGHHSDWYTNHWGHNMVRRIANLKTFSKADCSLRLSNGSDITNISDSPTSPDRENHLTVTQFIESATETIL